MTIIAVSNLSMDWGGRTEDTTDLTERDPNYSPTGIKTPISTPMALQPFSTPVGDLWLHFRWHTSFSASIGSDGHVLSFLSDNDIVLARLDMSDGAMAAQVFGDTTVAGTYIQRPSNSTETIDIRLSVTSAEITMDLYIGGGGAPISSATSANTSGQKSGPVRLLLDLNDISDAPTDINYFSEFIITDNEDTRGWRLATLEPNANGNYNEWLGDIAELGDRDPATSASSNTGGQRQSWLPTAYAGPNTVSSIRAVVAKAQTARGSGASPSQIAQFLRLSGVDYDGVNNAFLAGERKDIIEVWDDNPATTSPWTTADLATIEAGLLSVT